MKIEIENELNDIDEIQNLMQIIRLSKSSHVKTGEQEYKEISLFTLIEAIGFYFKKRLKSFLEYGKGGNHVWISYKNKRILLITETK